MIHGLNSQEVALLTTLVIEPLKDLGCEVWVFGSRARGDQKNFSDIDLLFSSPKPIKAAHLFEIKDAIIESDLPYKVDLVNESDTAESYRESVLRDRKKL